MYSYVPTTAAEREKMLASIGLGSMDELYRDVPAALKLGRELDLGKPMSELELIKLFKDLTKCDAQSLPLFRGASAYRRYIPSAIWQLLERGEFLTAYTPYQAEMSQGMLQGLFEYQTMICELTGMEASNASVYDGATAAAEAVTMCTNSKRKHKMAYSAGLHPFVVATIKTYARFAKTELVEVPMTDAGVTDSAALKAALDGCAGFIASQPTFYGTLENMDDLCALTHEAGALFVAHVDPTSLGLIKRPGEYGADIAVGDAQSLGMPIAFGGPYCGFMAATQKLMRNLPGRIAGQTEDKDGNRAFVLTLQAREQHIRREKASSNICSNQMLCALAATMYLAFMGRDGLKEVAEQSMQKAHYLAEGLASVKGAKLRFEGTPFFDEFVVYTDKCAIDVDKALRGKGFVGGLPIVKLTGKPEGMLWCATERNTREELDAVICAFEEVVK